jgi:F-type H+-transporting ATPase subunit a
MPPTIEQAEGPIVFSCHFLGFENWINPITVSWVSFGLVFLLLWIAKRRPKTVPTGIQNFVELVIDFVDNMSGPIVGKHAPFFFPLFFMLFLFIFFSNLMGLVPGLTCPTSRVDVNASMALIVFFSTHFWGIKQKGLIYFEHFLPPKMDVDPKAGLMLKLMMKGIYYVLCLMMPVIHLAGELIKPVSLTFRLFGNMMGKEKVLAVSVILVTFFWSGSTLFKFISSFPFLLRVFIVVLGVFICFIQAFVFMLLAMVYIGGAVQQHEEHGEGQGAEHHEGEAAHG